jgi:hypothetical protein
MKAQNLQANDPNGEVMDDRSPCIALAATRSFLRPAPGKSTIP